VKNVELYDELVRSLKIDKHMLDRELIQLPDLFHQVAREVAMAISRRDRARDEREKVRAKAYGRVRAKLDREGAKVTEALLGNQLALDSEVQTAERAVRDTSEEAGLWEALQSSWDKRSYALKDLVVLHVKAYDQSPSSTAGSVAAAREAGDRDNREIKKENYKPLQERPVKKKKDG